jgi:hypothetical protein
MAPLGRKRLAACHPPEVAASDLTITLEKRPRPTKPRPATGPLTLPWNWSTPDLMVMAAWPSWPREPGTALSADPARRLATPDY